MITLCKASLKPLSSLALMGKLLKNFGNSLVAEIPNAKIVCLMGEFKHSSTYFHLQLLTAI
jgi:hypothetical protein